MKKLDITKYDIINKKIPPEFNGFKIVQITDLHNEVFGENNKILISKIDEISPDIVVLTGDLIIGRGESYEENIKLLKYISNKYKTYSVLGNHEQEAMVGKHAQYYDNYFKILEELNITHLNNNSVKINKGNGSINIYGLVIPLSYYPHAIECLKKIKTEMENEILEDVLGNASDNEFNIMLAHNPLFFDDYAKWNVDLVFSGHIHGGMIRVPGLGGLLSPTRRFFPKYDWGKFEVNNSTLILSRGMGGGGFVPRILCSPEIMYVTLHKG